jgi:hypothetical protein
LAPARGRTAGRGDAAHRRRRGGADRPDHAATRRLIAWPRA